MRLTPDELSHALSLNASELSDFLAEIPDEFLDAIATQIDEAARGDGVQNYADAQSARISAIQNAKTAAGQEIGPLPAVVNPKRKEECRRDNIKFAETYFAATFYLPWASYQRAMMDRFRDVILTGGKECHAVRRGGLKSTCARLSTLWAVVYGHRRFAVLVGATDDKSDEHRDNLFSLMDSSQYLIQDFPELIPLLMKRRQPKKQYRLDGRLLTLSPKNERGQIVFPDIHTADCCEAHVTPFSVMSTDVSGLSFVDRFGVSLRPDLIVYDDVQSHQSANSPLMTDEREERITKTFGGLAGIGQQMAQIMVCTVREHNDLTERFLDRKRHPDWHGKRYKSLLKMPERTDLWDQYAVKLGSGDTPKDGKRQAQSFYELNRVAMDEGARVAWEYDKLPDELSALQSLMTVRALDPEFFRAEIQQDGTVPVNTTGILLDAQTLMTRLSHVDRGVIPEQSSYTVGFIDSSDQVLWWMICAFAKDFSGWIVDYGTWPDQGRPLFYKSDLAAKISQQKPGASWEEAFVYAHNLLEDQLFRDYPELDLLLKDWSDGGQKPRIESQIMASKNRSRIRPSKGFAPRPGRKPVHLWGDPIRDRHGGCGWVEKRSETPVHVQYNVNEWKSHAARRLLTTIGAPSAITLPGTAENGNRLLCEQFTAERPKTLTYDGASGIVWELLPARDNDWWDCFVGCCVAASMLGVGVAGEKSATRTQERRVFALPGGVRR